MRKFRIKVTTDPEEYYKWSGSGTAREYYSFPDFKGCYINGIIYVKTLSPFSLGHEMVHHVIGMEVYNSASLCLFRDIIQTFWDIAYYRLTRIRSPKERSYEALRRLKESINDWLNWILCREIEEDYNE